MQSSDISDQRNNDNSGLLGAQSLDFNNSPNDGNVIRATTSARDRKGSVAHSSFSEGGSARESMAS